MAEEEKEELIRKYILPLWIDTEKRSNIKRNNIKKKEKYVYFNDLRINVISYEKKSLFFFPVAFLIIYLFIYVYTLISRYHFIAIYFEYSPREANDHINY